MAPTRAFIDALRARVRGEVRADEPLARYTTYRIGGPATVVLPQSTDDVVAAVEFAVEQGIPWFAVGLGSNLLFPDEGLSALVIRIGKGLDRIDHDGDLWRIGAGSPGPLAARKTVAEGFGGLQKFVGIPGSVGGGVYMNAGAHGGDWSEVVESVRVLTAEGEDHLVPRSEIPFAYRRSGLGRVVVVETTVLGLAFGLAFAALALRAAGAGPRRTWAALAFAADFVASLLGAKRVGAYALGTLAAVLLVLAVAQLLRQPRRHRLRRADRRSAVRLRPVHRARHALHGAGARRHRCAATQAHLRRPHAGHRRARVRGPEVRRTA